MMNNRMLAKMAAAGTAAVLCAGSSTASERNDPVLLICDDPAADLCSALATKLDAVVKDRAVEVLSQDDPLPEPYHLVLRFITDSRSPSWVTGHLAWTTSAPDRSGVGPQLELSTSDTTLSPRMLEDYAALLLRESDLPL